MKRFLRHPIHELRHPRRLVKRLTHDRAVQRTVMWVLAIAVFAFLYGGLKHEGDVREEQFCHLVNDAYADQLDRYDRTVSYLQRPVGQERNGINNEVRRALPEQRLALVNQYERIPPPCVGVEPKPVSPPGVREAP